MRELPILFSAPMVRADLEDRKTMTRRVVKPYRKHPIVNLAIAEPTLGFSGRYNDPDSWGYEFMDDGAPAALSAWPELCPYGQPGDRLRVKETFFAWGRWETRYNAKKGRDEWHFVDMTAECDKDYLYAADGVSDTTAFVKRRSGVVPMYWKRPAIFMPYRASRITLEVTGVRVERLQDITSADILAEGVQIPTDPASGNVLLDVSSRYGPAHFLTKADLTSSDAVLRAHWAALWVSINGMDSWAANPWVWVIEFKRVEAQAA